MTKEEIRFGDWERILLGEAPWIFMLEVLFRTVLMYLILLVVLRLMGKRMGGQLSIAELAVMLTLGAIISLPMQAPEKGLLQGALVLGCAFAFQRGLNYLGFKSSRAEHIIQGRESMLVYDGVINVKKMLDTRISNQQLFAVLRSQNIYNLGEVERVYLEPSGQFSIYRFKEPRAGLSLLPASDPHATEIMEQQSQQVCEHCGEIQQQSGGYPCPKCENTEKTNAVKSTLWKSISATGIAS